MKKLALLLFPFLLLLHACGPEDTPVPVPQGLGRGVFILNEGNFNSANASLTYFDRDSDEVLQQLFFSRNDAPLGDVAQSITLFGDRAFVVVNNSGLVYVIDRKTADFLDKVTGLVSPRYLLVVDDTKAYVSDLFSHELAVIDLRSLTQTSAVPLGRTSENLLRVGDEVFVTNWSAYNQDKVNNQVLVVDAVQDVLVDSVTVGIEPNSMVLDKNGKLWVLCSGGFTNQENPTLWQIDAAERTVLRKLTFAVRESSPSGLAVSPGGSRLYWIDGDVFSMAIDQPVLPEQPFISGFAQQAYRLAVHPVSGEIFLTDALDYVRNGRVFRFDDSGQVLDTIPAGIIPGNMAFNE